MNSIQRHISHPERKSKAMLLTAALVAALAVLVGEMSEVRSVLAQQTEPGQIVENGKFYDDFSRQGAEIGEHYRAITADIDRDLDGLSDLEEIERGTDPRHADTDRDGIGDGDEVNADLNPLDASDSPIRSTFGAFTVVNSSVPVAPDAVGPVVAVVNTVPPQAYLERTLARPVRVEAHPPTIIAESHFDTDDEDWQTFGDAQRFTGTPDYVPEDEETSGKICATDENLFGVWDWRAPTKFLGNIAFGYGESLTLDLTQSGDGSPVDDEDIVLVGGGIKLVLALPNTPSVDWSSYSFPLDESSGWKNAKTGNAATKVEMLAVLWSLNDLRLRGEYTDGPDQGCLDNVVLYGHNDNDGDGLPLFTEKALGLIGREADTDGNGISDGLEDFDGDGLANAYEVLLLLDPTRTDTDENGVPDGEEDPDADGVPHAEEIEQGTNPFAADSDNDGLTDGQEVELQTNPLLADTDGDAFGDGSEVGAASDPLVLLLTPVGDTVSSLSALNTHIPIAPDAIGPVVSALNTYIPVAPDAIGPVVSALNTYVPMADDVGGRVFSVTNAATE